MTREYCGECVAEGYKPNPDYRGSGDRYIECTDCDGRGYNVVPDSGEEK